MGFFDKLFGGKHDAAPKFAGEKMTVMAPIDGTVIPLEQIPDETFATAILGPGCGIEPTGDTVYAPFDGTITQVASTLHAIGITSDDGIELLIHVGMDTVEMQGKGFTALVKEEQKVKAGTALLKVDRSGRHPRCQPPHHHRRHRDQRRRPAKAPYHRGRHRLHRHAAVQIRVRCKKTSAVGRCLFCYAHAFSGLYCRTRSETRPLKNWMKGPRQNAQMRVPRPTRPPRSQQSRAQKASVKTRQPKYWKCV